MPEVWQTSIKKYRTERKSIFLAKHKNSIFLLCILTLFLKNSFFIWKVSYYNIIITLTIPFRDLKVSNYIWLNRKGLLLLLLTKWFTKMKYIHLFKNLSGAERNYQQQSPGNPGNFPFPLTTLWWWQQCLLINLLGCWDKLMELL